MRNESARGCEGNVTLRDRRVLFQRLYPTDPEYRRLASDWSRSAFSTCLSYLWSASDKLKDALHPIRAVTDDDSSIERSITQCLVPMIREAKPSESPFEIEHGSFEFETLASPQAQPPQYDMAFVLIANRSIMWPIEAKVLRTDGRLADYIQEIVGNFRTCRYAPLTGEGGMLGYLLSGVPQRAFDNIALQLGSPLLPHPLFKLRNHRVSYHKRTVPPLRDYPRSLCCHHLIIAVGEQLLPQ